MMTFEVVRDCHFVENRQLISNYHLGYTRVSCWRVKVTVGRHSFVSRGVYATEDGARRAAARLAKNNGVGQVKADANG